LKHWARLSHPCLGMDNTPTVTLTEAAKRLGVSRTTISRYLDRGILKCVRLPTGVRRVTKESLAAALAGMRGEA
jgi:excisionase family DNA binding protein